MSRLCRATSARQQGTRLGATPPFEILSSRTLTPALSARKKRVVTMMSTSEQPLKTATLSTGLLSLDITLGGGIPKGGVVEIFGEEGSGKTLLATQICAEAQKPDHHVQYLDVEDALSRENLTEIGVVPDRFKLAYPKGIDEAFDVMAAAIRSGTFSAICMDNVAAALSLAGVEGSNRRSKPRRSGGQPGPMATGMRKVMYANEKANDDQACTLLFVNQPQSKTDPVYGDADLRPGGKALPYYASLSFRMRAVKKLEDRERNVLGQRVQIQTVKNRLAPPKKLVELDLFYGKGYCPYYSLLDGAVMLDVVRQRALVFNFEGNKLGKGRSEAVETLKKNPGLVDELREKTGEAFERRGPIPL